MSKVVEGNSLDVLSLAETLCNANMSVKLNSTMDFIKQIKFSELFKQVSGDTSPHWCILIAFSFLVYGDQPDISIRKIRYL